MRVERVNAPAMFLRLVIDANTMVAMEAVSRQRRRCSWFSYNVGNLNMQKEGMIMGAWVVMEYVIHQQVATHA